MAGKTMEMTVTYQVTSLKPKHKSTPSRERSPEEIARYCRMKRLSRGATRLWLCIRENYELFRFTVKPLTWIDETFGFTPKARNAALRELELLEAILRQRMSNMRRGTFSLSLSTPHDFHRVLREAAEIEARKTGRAA
jgi:hypothetical protein